MTLYDKLIGQIQDILPANVKQFKYGKSSLKANTNNDILFLSDTAYELGGSQKPCVSTTLVSSKIKFNNSILLFGKDLPQIKGDCPFGKIVFLEVEELDENDAFDKIKELERVRYKLSPQGFMMRASALNMREQIRVSKKAVKGKVTFADYGSFLMDEYLKNPIVKSAQIIFLTEFDRFDELRILADKVNQTTSALNHIFDNILFDCSSCNLKPICDEVEGMKELHMNKAKSKTTT